MPKKKGPPYEDDPECQYVVIENPWPANLPPLPGLFYNWVCAWLSYMFDPREWPEELYYMKTRGDVVVRFPQDVDLSHIYGAHFWPNFIDHKRSRRPAPPFISYIFPYNYRRHGHPPEHNWSTHVPDSDPPPHHRLYQTGQWPPPIKTPYPEASWADLNSRTCAQFALPIPEQRSPNPMQQERAQPAAVPEVERPAHFALAHQLADARDEPQEPTPEPTPPPPEQVVKEERVREPARLFVNKLDPYDEDDNAAQLLKAEPVDEVLPSGVRIKAEPGASGHRAKVEQEEAERRASAELYSVLEDYHRRLGQDEESRRSASDAPPVRVKPEPELEKDRTSPLHPQESRGVRSPLASSDYRSTTVSTPVPEDSGPSTEDMRFDRRQPFASRTAKRMKTEDMWPDDFASNKRFKY